ncbi:cation-translocating P-type ATPase [Candidatus Woesearchaeota archaeon]|nr:cation-translocating P-type ATPase [Candidatus Woesearchaeota archaeon]
MVDYYNVTSAEALSILNTSKKGLASEEAQKRLFEYGPNILYKEKRFTAIKLFISQFKNTFLLLLILAAAISFIVGQTVEGTVIIGILFLNAILGFVQEYRAEKAVEALEKLSAPTAKVMRDGNKTKIPAIEVVPGDILVLEAGDIVPADSRIIEASSLHIDEASLTGESMPSRKVTDIFKIGTSIADQENMAFMGTTVTYGKGIAVVTATSMKTEMGKIAATIQKTPDTPTPLQTKFKQLAQQIGIITVILIITVLTTGTLSGTQTFAHMLIFVLALTVSTIPNSLPIIVTVSLAMGAKRLAKKNMLIKKLSAAESLGATTIICTDKTGTLTKNQMTVTNIYADNKTISVTGTGYTPKGTFVFNNRPIPPKKIELLLKIGYLCNNAKLTQKDGRYDIIGDPTEGALIVLGKKGGLNEDHIHEDYKIIEELPFDSDRKRMSVICQNTHSKTTEAYTKGAPDVLLHLCTTMLSNGKIKKLTQKDKQKILATNTRYANSALRVLALAYKDVSKLRKYSVDAVEKDLTFVGLVGMIDPPRDEVSHAIKECEDAGIKVMMITGDHALTAEAVAKQIGLYKKGDIILTGNDVDKLTDKELETMIDKVCIVARALPIQKTRIVDALQKKGHVVAMTGDGVNDAPALKKADIGIAMGITGTDVAKETAKAILVDDNFATIVNAVAEGRNIYDKMLKSAMYLLSCNAGEIISVFAAIMLNFPLPLLPLQLLLISILTDDFPALGLGLEAMEEDVMKLPPRNPKEKPIHTKNLVSILLFGLIMSAGTLAMFVQYKDVDLTKAQTIAFTTLVLFQMFAVISSKTFHHSAKALNPLTNKLLITGISLSILLQITVLHWQPLQLIFGTTALTLKEWLAIIGISSIGFIAMEASKFLVHPTQNKSV